jgi:hypothetical protein
MFQIDRIPLRVSDVSPRKPIEHDEKEIPLVEVTFELNPLTPALAGELDDVVKRVLFTMRDVEANPKVRGVSFDLAVKPQQIAIHDAPDLSRPTFTIEEAKVDSFKAKRSKKSSAWTLEFKATFSPASERQLAQVIDAYLKTRYCTFQNAAPGLFDEIEKEERRESPDAAPVRRGRSSGEGATAH